MKYRKAILEELEYIYEVVQNTIAEVYPRYYLKEIVDMFSEFHNKDNIAKDIIQGELYLLALDDNTIIGTGTANKNHITRVYVLPKYQGKGYGTYIMHQLESVIAKKYNKAEIDASLPACGLYAKLGYKTVDHGIWNCANDVIQVYEIMEKDLREEKELNKNLRLRPYKPCDADKIVTWCRDEFSFRQWSADRWDQYPLTPEAMNEKYLGCNGDCIEEDNFYPMTFTDGDEVTGHLILRYTDKEKQTIRFGFVIVDAEKRGKGYGKQMLLLAKKYALEILNATKVTLGIFDNNPSAYYCYKAAGFEEIKLEEDIYYDILGEKWKCMEMEAGQ